MRAQVRAYLDDELDELGVSSLRHAREIFAQFKALYREQAKRVAAPATAPHGSGGGDASQQPEEFDMPPVEVVEFVGDLTAGERSGGFSCGEAPDTSRPVVPDSELLPRPRTDRVAAAERGAVHAELALYAPPVALVDAKARAYEDYKRGPGQELSSLLTEHKARLREKRAQVRSLAVEVNASKNSIDELKELLELKAEQRLEASLREVTPQPYRRL